jgi:kynurenine formamidase
MRIRSYIIAYALVLAILLFADRRTGPVEPGRYSHVVDLTGAPSGLRNAASAPGFPTRIVAPGNLIPGTWNAGQIPAERLIAPLVVMDVKADDNPATIGSKLSLEDVADWEAHHGPVPQGAVVAIRRGPSGAYPSNSFPITAEAAQFLMDARYSTGFAIETSADFASDRPLARQVALHGNYVVESAARLAGLPATGSLVIVAPTKSKTRGKPPVRVLAMVQ